MLLRPLFLSHVDSERVREQQREEPNQLDMSLKILEKFAANEFDIDRRLHASFQRDKEGQVFLPCGEKVFGRTVLREMSESKNNR